MNAQPEDSSSLPKGSLNPAYLFPCDFKEGFTTASPSAILPPNLTLVKLQDDVLNVTRVSSGTTHDVMSDPPGTLPGTQAWGAVYPEGSINPKNQVKGGFGFYVAGPRPDFSFESATEVLLSYGVYFEPGFDFNRGGKLPGLYGGTTPEVAYGCSGGRKEGRDQCFSLRLMWRRKGDGEIYAYLPVSDANKEVLSNVPPRSELNPDFGYSVGRGAWRFVPGQWAVVAQRVKLNDVGECNGEIDIWVNGQKVICVAGIVIRQDPDTVFRGAHFQTFFGGHTAEWASPKDQYALFANVSAAIIR